MNVAFTNIRGLTLYDMRRAFNGVTLLTPAEGTRVFLVDMLGGFVHQWEMGYKPALYGELLPNGNLLYAGKVEDGPLTDFEGAGGVLLEIDWDGKKVWQYKDPYLHHAFWRMKSGNTLVIRWIEMPEAIAARVKVEGTDPAIKRDGPMWGDAVQEVTPEGKVVWEWVAHEHLDQEVDLTCPICPPNEWTHANSVGELPDGNIMLSFMETNTIVVIDKKSGTIKWRFGKRVLRHHHFVTVLDNGNLLIFDNDLHSLAPRAFCRVIEVDTKVAKPTAERIYLMYGAKSNAIVWSYQPSSPALFYSGGMASCQRLPNGNTLICEGTTGRIFEVTQEGHLVWEFVNNLPFYEMSPTKSRAAMVSAAFRYGMDYSGLKRLAPLPVEKQAAPGMPSSAGTKEEEKGGKYAKIISRLETLGY